MRKGDDALDDLIVLARRGDLPDGDNRRLRELLASATVERELYEAGRALDAEAPVQSDDAARLDRLVGNVERRLADREPKRPWPWLTRAVVAGSMLTAAAVGATRLVARDEPPAPAAAPASEPPPPTPVAPARPHAPEAVQPIEPEPLVERAPVVAPPPAPRAPQPVRRVAPAPATTASAVEPAPPPVEHPPSAPTAAELFAAANRARVRGDLAEAIRISHELEARHPQSAEAATARLSLGMLYLQLDQPERALAEFRRGGDAAEAMWGTCQALRALGRDPDERTALEALLARHPSSVYATAARKRLDALR